MAVRPVAVHFWWVRKVAVFVDQLEHELLTAELGSADVFARRTQ